MQAYADYAFYTDTYHGEMDEKRFALSIIPATQYIRYLTMNRADNYQGDELKYAACAAADLYDSAAQGAEKRVGRVKSENTDGYLVNYASEGKDGETDEELTDRKVYAAVRKWLLPTGLLNRRVGCACADKCVFDHL